MDSCERLSRDGRGLKNDSGSYQKAAAPTIPNESITRHAAIGTSSKPLKALAIEETIGYYSGIQTHQGVANPRWFCRSSTFSAASWPAS
jgi:hypothetical protein